MSYSNEGIPQVISTRDIVEQRHRFINAIVRSQLPEDKKRDAILSILY